MPILPSEPSIYPEDLFAESAGSYSPERTWWVLHTRPRQEKAVARALLGGQLSFYLPLFSRRAKIRGRVVESHLPLFPGYVFLLGTDPDRIAALTTQRVVRSIPVGSTGELWQDLRQIHTLIASGVPVTPEQRLEPGMLVEIRSGKFVGMKGRIIRSGTGKRFVVSVNFIQQGASLTVEDYEIAPIDSL